MTHFNENFTKIEKNFNIAASIPVVSLFSSPIRLLAGKVQFLAGALIGLFGFVGQVATNNEKWKEFSKLGAEHFIHGALNFIRGWGELLISFTLIGSIGLGLLQSGSNQFAPVIPYDKPALSSMKEIGEQVKQTAQGG